MRILIVDDDAAARQFLRHLVAKAGELEIHEANSLLAARQALAEQPFEVVLIDICLDERNRRNRDGLTLVREVREQTTAAPIIVTVASEMAEIRVAIRHGAHSYILKDELCEELVVSVLKELQDKRSLEDEVLALHGLVGTSPAMERLRRTIRRVADSDGPAIIVGPTGSGKELVARAIHTLSSRRSKPLVAVNCSALTESLAESLLFGHEKGFFSGADKARPGFIGEVEGGTLFLDEIAELALPLQAKILRVLENRTFRALGASADSSFDGRVLAATHVDLDGRRKEGRFRDDLYYRLGVLTVRVPTLDERKEDIPLLAERFAREARRPVVLSDGAKAALRSARWPGNVRELRNLIHRLAVFVDGGTVEAADVHEHMSAEQSGEREPARTLRSPPGLMAGISLRATKRENSIRLAQNQIRLLEEEGASTDEICRIVGVARSSIYRMKLGQDSEESN